MTTPTRHWLEDNARSIGRTPLVRRLGYPRTLNALRVINEGTAPRS